MSQPTDLQYAKFGAYTSGILDGLVQSGSPDKEDLMSAISLLLTGMEIFGIEVQYNNSDPAEEH